MRTLVLAMILGVGVPQTASAFDIGTTLHLGGEFASGNVGALGVVGAFVGGANSEIIQFLPSVDFTFDDTLVLQVHIFDLLYGLSREALFFRASVYVPLWSAALTESIRVVMQPGGAMSIGVQRGFDEFFWTLAAQARVGLEIAKAAVGMGIYAVPGLGFGLIDVGPRVEFEMTSSAILQISFWLPVSTMGGGGSSSSSGPQPISEPPPADTAPADDYDGW